MKVTNEITIYLDDARRIPPIHAVQSDTARYVEVSLYAGDKAWEIPSQSEIMIRYRRSDGAGGTYDTLADGSKAWSISENTVTIALDPMVLAVSGNATVQIAIQNGNAIVSTFSFAVHVQADPSASSVKPADTPMLRGAYVVTLEANDVGTYSANRTSKEIYSAYQKGLELRCLVPVGDMTTILTLVSTISNDGYMTYVFGSTAAWLDAAGKSRTMSARIADGQEGLDIAVKSDEIVSIASIEQVRKSTEDSGTNILAVKLTDGRQEDFIVRNGHSGVYVGSEEPTDEDVDAWIDPEGEPYYPQGGSGYTLPIATPDTLGGVKPAAKTEDMTEPVGVDEFGGLWVSPASASGNSGGEVWRKIAEVETTEELSAVDITTDLDGNAFNLKKLLVIGYVTPVSEIANSYAIQLCTDKTIVTPWGQSHTFIGYTPKATETASHMLATRELIMGAGFTINNLQISPNKGSLLDILNYPYGTSPPLAVNAMDKGVMTNDCVIDRCFLGSYLTCIGIGSKFTVYGVDL